MEISNFSIILEQVLKYSAYLYKNFSFPLLLLIVILVFRKEITGLLNRIHQINFENNAGKVSVSLAEIAHLKDAMEVSESFQIRHLGGEDPRDNIHLGEGQNIAEENNKFNEYFSLINLPEKVFKEVAKNGHFKTIEHLYNAFEFLTKDFQNENYEPTKIIKSIYDTVRDIDRNGGYLLDDDLVYRYRSFIQLACLELMQNNEIESED